MYFIFGDVMLGWRGGFTVLLYPVKGCQYACDLENIKCGATDTHICAHRVPLGNLLCTATVVLGIWCLFRITDFIKTLAGANCGNLWHSGRIRPRQRTEICNFGAPSPLDFFQFSPVDSFSIFSRFTVKLGKQNGPKSVEKIAQFPFGFGLAERGP